MTIDTRLREHLAAKAETIPAQPPPLPQPARRARRRLSRPVLALAAAAVVIAAVGAAAWLSRATDRVEPATPDLEDLTPTLQTTRLGWSQLGALDLSAQASAIVVGGDLVVVGARSGEFGVVPFRMWRAPLGEPLRPVAIDEEQFGEFPFVTEVVWDGRRFHAFGGRFRADPTAGAGPPTESAVWSSADGVAWEERSPLLGDDGTGGSPFVRRTLSVLDVAASSRGILAAGVSGNEIDWDAYLADRLGDGYVPGSHDVTGFDGEVYTLFDGDGRLLARVAQDELGFDPGIETTVLFSLDGDEYRAVEAIPATISLTELAVQASDAGLFVLGAAPGEPSRAWVSTDGESWSEVAPDSGGAPLEVVRGDGWGDLFVGAVRSDAGRVVVASQDGASWTPLSPPLAVAQGVPGPEVGLAAGPGGVFAFGTQQLPSSGPEEIAITKGDYRVRANPSSRIVYVVSAAGGEPIIRSSMDQRQPSGLPAGFEPALGTGVRAVDPATGDTLLELTGPEWRSLAVDAEPDVLVPGGWYAPDGSAWSFEDLGAAFDGTGLAVAAAVSEEAVVVLFSREAPGNDLEVWLGSPG